MTELIAICDICRRPVADRMGYLYIDLIEVREYEDAARRWRAEHPGPVAATDILDSPVRPCWRVCHGDCDTDDSVSDYAIEVERIRSWRDLCWWTAHLFDKNWFSLTDWGHLMRGVAENSGTRIQPAGTWERAA